VKDLANLESHFNRDPSVAFGSLRMTLKLGSQDDIRFPKNLLDQLGFVSKSSLVIPAKAGIQCNVWITAVAGITL
jgi:hypothetical protein